MGRVGHFAWVWWFLAGALARQVGMFDHLAGHPYFAGHPHDWWRFAISNIPALVMVLGALAGLRTRLHRVRAVPSPSGLRGR